MLKKAIATALTMAMVMTLSGCGSSAGTKSGDAPKNTYPTKPVKIVVPFNPGATTDLLAQELAKRLEKEWGQPVIVEHKEGGGGAPGLLALKNGGADGYTFMVNTAAFVNQVSLIKGIDYQKDFQAVARFGRSDASFQAHKNTKFKTIKELIDYAKANPGKVQVGVGTVGGNNHISGELFVKATGIDAVIVPFGSGSETRAATLGGHCDVGIMSVGASEAQLKSGDLILLGTMGPERDKNYPNAPTLKELGYDSISTQWYGMFAHKNAPPEVVEKVIASVKKVQATPEWKEVLKKLQADDYAAWGKEFEKDVLKEIEENKAILKKAGLLK